MSGRVRKVVATGKTVFLLEAAFCLGTGCWVFFIFLPKCN